MKMGAGLPVFSGQVLGKADEEPPRHRHAALVTALALGDEQAMLAGGDVLQAQAEHLATAQAAEQHRLHNGPVPMGAQSGHEAVHLVG